MSPLLLTICLFGNSLLRTKAVPVKIFDDARKTLYKRMLSIMQGSKGIGLAAQQIGWNEHVLVINLAGVCRVRPDLVDFCIFDGQKISVGKIMPLVVINSVITWTSPEKVPSQEGCLSIPGIQGTVERFKEIEIRFQDPDGREHTLRCDRLFSFCVQHERDHLEGVLFIDHLGDEVRDGLEKRLLSMEEKGKKQKMKPLL
ncbi:MAG: peptide deformylase [Puniceicoccales bacterium]|jgi:peptide deformylase|nr:peptide deformylase [Puniceicoccales bacterium]